MNHAQSRSKSEQSSKDELHHLLVEHLPAQDEFEFKLGDTLDIKMSIFLVAIVFLATQSGVFLALKMPLHWHITQICSLAALVVSLALALWELKPRTYDVRMGNEDLLEWVEKLRAFYDHEGVPDPDARVIEQIQVRDIQRARERIAVNRRINEIKSRFTEWCFYSTMVAAILNAVTLIAQSTGWRF
jgi:hypothetical protein